MKGPGTLVVSTYVTVPDIRKVATPDIKFAGHSKLYFIDIGQGKSRLGGSALAQTFQQIGDHSPDVEDINFLKRSFTSVQTLIRDGLIQTGHDVSDGGLIVTLLEMAFAGNCGLEICVEQEWISAGLIAFLFAEELGLVFEVETQQEAAVQNILEQHQIPFRVIASTLIEKTIKVSCKENHKKQLVFNDSMTRLRDIWNETSAQLEMRQATPQCVKQETEGLKLRSGLKFHFTFTPEPTSDSILNATSKPSVAILREEGSNGDREMAAAFHAAGFSTWDVTTSDLINKRITLDRFRGIAFVGGFSFADVLDSGKGWAAVLRFHKDVWNQLQTFYQRPNTFSLGVCNGCQLGALLGWIPFSGLADADQPRFVHNVSGRYESRFSEVTILPSPAVLLKGMEGSQLGVWTAHGEGQAYFPNPHILDRILNQNLAPIRYIDDNLQITEAYPHNPSTSPKGIAALCSPDGRHLFMMPHPERTHLIWQWPYLDPSSKHSLKASPWLKLFQNARIFCEQHPS